MSDSSPIKAPDARPSKEIIAEIKLNVISSKQKESIIRKLTLSNSSLSTENEELQVLTSVLQILIEREGNTPDREKLMDSYKKRASEIVGTINENNRTIKVNSAQLAQLQKDSNELNKELEDSLQRELEAKIRLTKTFVDLKETLNGSLLYPATLTIVKNTNVEVLSEKSDIYVKIGVISELIGDTVLTNIDYNKVSFSDGEYTANYYTTSYSYDLTLEPTSVFLLFDYENLRTDKSIWVKLKKSKAAEVA
jgi:hypothetical protein